MERIYDYEERLVRFAGEIIKFVSTVPKDYVGEYYRDQLVRSSGSSALNYGEVQGATTNRDYLHKMSLVIKELKESRCSLKILKYAEVGKKEQMPWLLSECEELIAIGAKIISNRQKQVDV